MRTPRHGFSTLAAVLVLSGCGGGEKAAPVVEQPTEEPSRYALCAPIPPDQMGNWKAMIEEMKAKHDAHVASNESVGIAEELVWLQETPQGVAAVVYFEGNDLAHMMSRRAASKDDYTEWFVSQIRSIHKLPENMDEVPVNELVFRGDVAGVEGETKPFALAVPILPGKEAVHAAFVAEMAGPRHAAWEESRRSRGIAKEYAWNQKAPDGTIMTVVYFEITDPANLNKPPVGEFESWFRAQLADIHGVSPEASMPANVLAAAF